MIKVRLRYHYQALKFISKVNFRRFSALCDWVESLKIRFAVQPVFR